MSPLFYPVLLAGILSHQSMNEIAFVNGEVRRKKKESAIVAHCIPESRMIHFGHYMDLSRYYLFIVLKLTLSIFPHVF